MIKLLFLLTTAFAQTDIDQITVEGNVMRSPSGKLQIKLDNQLYWIVSNKRQTQDDLDHLESGDHVIGLGRIQGAQKTVWLEDLEMVGVRKVLGTWKDYNKARVFNFQDFHSLSVKDPRGSRNLTYRLVPDKKDIWTIFLTADTSIKTGTMKYSDEEMEIEFIDLNSGRVVERVELATPRRHQ